MIVASLYHAVSASFVMLLLPCSIASAFGDKEILETSGNKGLTVFTTVYMSQALTVIGDAISELNDW